MLRPAHETYKVYNSCAATLLGLRGERDSPRSFIRKEYSLARLSSANLGSPCDLKSQHFGRVCRKLPDQLLEPGVRNSELFGPIATGGPTAVATGQPLEYKLLDHLGFLTAAPGPGWPKLLARFCEVSH